MQNLANLQLALMILMCMPVVALVTFIGIPLIRALSSANDVKRSITTRR